MSIAEFSSPVDGSKRKRKPSAVAGMFHDNVAAANLVWYQTQVAKARKASESHPSIEKCLCCPNTKEGWASVKPLQKNSGRNRKGELDGSLYYEWESCEICSARFCPSCVTYFLQGHVSECSGAEPEEQREDDDSEEEDDDEEEDGVGGGGKEGTQEEEKTGEEEKADATAEEEAEEDRYSG
jgi:hypothetical protein